MLKNPQYLFRALVLLCWSERQIYPLNWVALTVLCGCHIGYNNDIAREREVGGSKKKREKDKCREGDRERVSERERERYMEKERDRQNRRWCCQGNPPLLLGKQTKSNIHLVQSDLFTQMRAHVICLISKGMHVQALKKKNYSKLIFTAGDEWAHYYIHFRDEWTACFHLSLSKACMRRWRAYKGFSSVGKNSTLRFEIHPAEFFCLPTE